MNKTIPTANEILEAYNLAKGSGVSVQSQLQRIRTEYAKTAKESDEETQTKYNVAKTALKFDKSLRDWMLAKEAKPDLKYTQFMSNPDMGGAYMKEGATKLVNEGRTLEPFLSGNRYKEITKSALKGLAGGTPNPTPTPTPSTPGVSSAIAPAEATATAGATTTAKSVLGKTTTALGGAYGAYQVANPESTTKDRVAGAMKIGGALASTNFWNPAGWVGGALLAGGTLLDFMGNDKRPIKGRYKGIV